MSSDTPGLIADIGGTNARFALAGPDREPRHPLVLPCAEFAGPDEAAAAYLRRVAPGCRPARAAFAVAGPVAGDTVAMTNHVWRFSIEAVRESLGLASLQVVNDFTAVALAVPLLRPEHRVAVGGEGAPMAGTPIGVIGPGTGLGVSALVPREGGGWTTLAAEGGHVTMAPVDEREDAVLSWLRGLYGHVSAERVVSGPGLVNLYSALCELEDVEPEPLGPDQITHRGLKGENPLCAEAVRLFFAMLGTVAGNLALTLGARQGVYIAGGIVPRFVEALKASRFRERFEAKGRFRGYLAPVPTHVVTHPYPAFLGLAGLVGRGAG